jgi:hypothetical protein
METVATMLVLVALAAPAAAIKGQGGDATPQTLRGQLILYDQPGYSGEEMGIDRQQRVLSWDHHPRSIAVHPGDRWEICALPRFRECIRLSRSVPDTAMIGIAPGRDIASIRPYVRIPRAATPALDGNPPPRLGR